LLDKGLYQGLVQLYQLGSRLRPATTSTTAASKPKTTRTITTRAQQEPARQTIIEAPPLDEQAESPVVVTVPTTRIICGEAAEQGARAIAQLLELQGEYDEQSEFDSQETDPTGT
jgi:hypothetical protein